MKTKRKTKTPPAAAMQREIAALDRAEQQVIAAAVKAEVREEHEKNAALLKIERQVAALKKSWRRFCQVHERETNRQLEFFDRRRNILQARLAAL